MKVRVTPIITRNEEGKIDLPVSNFSAITTNNDVVINTREVSLNDKTDPIYNILSDISHGSITPTTFISRNFTKESLETKIGDIIGRVISEKTELQNRFDAFKACHEESQARLKELSQNVIADGEFTKIDKDILSLSEKFIPKIAELENYYTELDQYMSFVTQNTDLDLSYCDVYSNDASEVTRFGINTAMMNTDHIRQLSNIYIYTFTDKKESVKSGKSSKSQKDAEISKTLHPLEVFLIQDAIEFLKEQNSKSVLIDIFVREDDGRIKIKDNKLDTHTIVLYFNRDIGKIILIDPSSTEFSKHIATNNLRLFGQSDDNVGIIIPPPQKIYAPFDKDNVGPMAHQYRDCIDLSVKIAFGLEKIPSYTNNIISSDAIIEVTNNQAVFSGLFFDANEAIARIRQTSNDYTRERVHKLLVSLNNLSNTMISEKHDNQALEVQKNSITTLETSNTSNIVSDLFKIYSDNMKFNINSLERDLELNVIGDAV